MMDHGIGYDAYLMARTPCTPAEVEILAIERELRIEATQCVPDITPDEHPG